MLFILSNQIALYRNIVYAIVPSMESNIFDTALIFEGGGLRASYTAAVVQLLLKNNLYFDNVYGVSAGSSHSCNYISRDIKRAKDSFVGFVEDPNFGNWDTFLAHKGYFNAEYIYEESGKPSGKLRFNITAFLENPAKITISAFRRDTGETVYWTKKNLNTLGTLMRRVRASSSLPIFMPPPEVDGYVCYDGGLGEGAGLMLPKAKADGFEKFFIVRTRPRGYRKKPGDSPFSLLFPKRKYLRLAFNTRNERYNAIADEIDELEAAGKAYVFYADDITAKSATTDIKVLEENFAKGYQKGLEELPKWFEFLGIEPPDYLDRPANVVGVGFDKRDDEDNGESETDTITSSEAPKSDDVDKSDFIESRTEHTQKDE